MMKVWAHFSPHSLTLTVAVLLMKQQVGDALTSLQVKGQQVK